MDKAQAIHNFWSSFNIPAYDEFTVPDDAKMPYITYNVSTGPLDGVQNLYASLWYKSYSWEEITHKADEIAKIIGEFGFYSVKIDGGYLFITLPPSFYQRMDDPSDDSIRRIYITVNAEFATAY